MSHKHIFIIIGTRPEAIKMAPVVKEIREHSGDLDLTVCSTGQHREMLDQVFSLFGIEPDTELDLMRHDQTLAGLTSDALLALAKALEEASPHLVLVQGDTTTAMIGAVASFYHKLPVGHVEAGLRTDDRYSPFPEEINRRLISVLAAYHFAPTQRAFDCLLNEGCPKENVFLTGNTVVDALLSIVEKEFELDFDFRLNAGRLILVTAHRRENHGKPLENICAALKEIARRNPDVDIVYPVHPNPNVQEPVYRILEDQPRIHLTRPLAYQEIIHLMSRSYLILTDSGGIQEEAPALGKPVLILRRETERIEAIEAGIARVVGTDTETIIDEVERLLYDQGEYSKMSRTVSLYGDGRASERIVDIILDILEPGCSRNGNVGVPKQ